MHLKVRLDWIAVYLGSDFFFFLLSLKKSDNIACRVGADQWDKLNVTDDYILRN